MVRAQGLGRRPVSLDLRPHLHKNLRRKGYVSRTLELVEDRAKELGAKSVELHVFGHNQVAQARYEKLGYNETSIIMAKPVHAEQA